MPEYNDEDFLPYDGFTSYLEDDPCCHPNLHLLAIERTGWRRWLFGRWVYSCEPFRKDIQRRNKETKMPLKPWERICDPSD